MARELPKVYDPQQVESRIYQMWEENGYFHAVKDIQPETYKAMVKLYGENLEHIEFGDPYQYRTVFIKYIYTPMYNYFNDPANRDYILSEFPDFPFDFPDPKSV